MTRGEKLLRFAEVPVPWCQQCERPMTLLWERRDFERRQVAQRLTCHQEVHDRILSDKQLLAIYNGRQP